MNDLVLSDDIKADIRNSIEQHSNTIQLLADASTEESRKLNLASNVLGSYHIRVRMGKMSRNEADLRIKYFNELKQTDYTLDSFGPKKDKGLEKE